jgi:pilus assembly protein CpaE
MAHPSHIRALMVCPSTEIVQKFAAASIRRKFFETISDISVYPVPAQLESKIRQARPDVLLIDVASDVTAATELIRHIAETLPNVPIVGLHTTSDANAILTTLRSGATEFLYAPFESSVQEAAVARIRKLIDPDGGVERARGKVVGFTSAKPGAGATTLAIQTACLLKRRVLLIDLNLNGGSAAWHLGLTPSTGIEALLAPGTRIDHGLWSQTVTSVQNFDLLASPLLPLPAPVDPGQIAHVLDHARGMYDWVVLDLPCVFEKLTQGCMSEADRSYVVSAPDLTSLHLTRRAVRVLRQLGFDNSRFGVLMNMMTDRVELSAAELKKVFECDVDRGLPADKTRMDQSLLQGTPLQGGAFGKAVEGLATHLMKMLGHEQETQTGRKSLNEYAADVR